MNQSAFHPISSQSKISQKLTKGGEIHTLPRELPVLAGGNIQFFYVKIAQHPCTVALFKYPKAFIN